MEGGQRLLPCLIFAMVAYSGADDQWHQTLNTPSSSLLPLECLLDFMSNGEEPIDGFPPFLHELVFTDFLDKSKPF